MKKLVSLLVILTMVQSSVFAIDNQFKVFLKKNPVGMQCSSKNLIARQGCCSHHGGVCGCTSGRALCCDGALSPSCGCDRSDEMILKNDKKGFKI